MGFSIKEITATLMYRFGINRSTRQIERRLRAMKLGKRRQESDIESIIEAISAELRCSGKNNGIKLMWHCLQRKHKLVVRRKTVRDIMDHLMPDELQNRKGNKLKRRVYNTKGPNHVLHADQYDKLAPFGFYIHGAIDGFSRKIAWLSVGNTNRDSSVILRFYLRYVQSIRGLPKIIRTDGGTENALMLKVHDLLHQHIGSTHTCCIVGRSVHNQRIERFWGYVRHHFTQRWIDLFYELLHESLYNPNNDVHYELLQFCFTGVLSGELHDLHLEWNHHRVRRTKGSTCPGGIPEVLFTVPELHGAYDQKCDIHDDFIFFTDTTLGNSLREYGCTDQFAEVCLEIMDIKGLDIPENMEEALDLYGNLFLIFENPELL